MTDITYESKILLNILVDLETKYGFTLGARYLTDYVRGRIIKSIESLHYNRYNGKLSELSAGYLKNVISYLEEKNYIETLTVASRIIQQSYIVTEKGKNFLNSDEPLMCDKLYRKYLMPGLLQFDPELYKKLYDIYGNLNVAITLALYLPDNLKDIESYIQFADYKADTSYDMLVDLYKCIQNHTVKYIDIVVPSYIEKITSKNIKDIIQYNADKLNIIDDDLSFDDIGVKFLSQLGLYVNKELKNKLNMYFINVFCKAYPLTSEIQNTIIEYLKASKKM